MKDRVQDILDLMRDTAEVLVLFLLEVFDALLVWGVLAAWRYITKTPVDPLLMGAAIGITLYACFRAWRKQFERAEAGSAAVAARESRKNRVFVDNPQRVLDLYRREDIRNPYFGQWIEISGEVDGVTESLLRDSLHMSLTMRDGLRIILRFPVDARTPLLDLRQGQRITAVCQIQGAAKLTVSGFPGFSLSNCELVSAEPLEPGRSIRAALAS